MRSSSALSTLLFASLALATAAACSGAGTAATPSPTSEGQAGTGDGAAGTSTTTGGSGGSSGAGAGATSGGQGGQQPTGAVLRIDPANPVLQASDQGGASVSFAVFFQAASGAAEEDVTTEAKFSLDDASLGVMVNGSFTAGSGAAGKTTVRAFARGLEATTTLTIAEQSVVIGPGAPPDAPSLFGGEADPSAAIDVVYPPTGIALPPNMNSLELHFVPAPGQSLFEISFEAKGLIFSAYTTCQPLPGGCFYAPDKTFWSTLADHARGAAPVTWAVRGVDGQNPGKVGASTKQTMQFAAEDIEGGLYYWNSAGSIQRFDFGLATPKSETYLNNLTAGALTCVGCHALSRDGTRIAVGLDIPAPAPFKVFDVATKKLLFQQGSTFGGGANFFSFSPDAKQIMTSDGVSIALRDAATGAAINEKLVPMGTMPDWAADGQQLVYAKPAQPPPFGIPIPGVDSASIDLISIAPGAPPGPVTLVPFEGQNNYYPSFSPDSKWVVFNRSPGNKNSFANGSTEDGNVPDGEVWVVSAAGGPAVRLATAAPGGDQWPKWSTAITTYEGGDLLWLTFSSRRAYGLRKPEGGEAQLWMTAFDPKKAAAGQDPATPAIWLPFQDIATGNHIAQWVTKVVRKPCKSVTDCEGNETCKKDTCLPDIK